MQETGIHGAQIVLLLLLFSVIAFTALARRLQTPYPIVLVIAGLLLGFVPGIPKVTLDPEVIFLVVLPPLLYAGAWVTSWRDFSYNLVSIAMLAIVLVGVTVWGVAEAGPWLFPDFNWSTGFVLGAVVATTDAIAATSIAKRIGLPKRIVDLLEGESLVNDSTGLLALEFALALVVSGQTPTAGAGFLRLLFLVAGGVGTGLILGRLVEWFEHHIDDGPIEIAVSILVPYATYLSAEAIHVSGVLAVVSAGLFLGRKSSKLFSPSVRIQAYAVWDSITFILNGIVFILIGLQLPWILAGVGEISTRRIFLYGGLFSVFLILLRLVWAYPGAWTSYLIRTRLLHQPEPKPEPKQVFVVGWTGMRGVIALAAAMSLPQTIAGGGPFPHRNLIIFLTFSVILVTLVVQGLTLPLLIRLLGLAGAAGPRYEDREARRLVLQRTLDRLDEMRRYNPTAHGEVYDDLAHHYRNRLASLQASPQQETEDAEHYFQFVNLSLALLEEERKIAIGLRDEGAITDEILREMERELDLNETRLAAATAYQDGEHGKGP